MTPTNKVYSNSTDASRTEPRVARLKMRELKSLKGAGITADPMVGLTSGAGQCDCNCPDQPNCAPPP